MNIVFYCQNVFGIGHLKRSLNLARELVRDNQVTFIQGGPDIGATINHPNFKHLLLPPLLMKDDGILYAPNQSGISEVFEARAELISEKLNIKADIFICEFFPFGRYQFRNEVFHIIETLKKTNQNLKTFCSMRDIYTHKPNKAKFEKRSLYCKDVLNQCFDALFIHSDPDFIKLSETYPYYDQIAIPIHYTGFVTPESHEHLEKKMSEVIVSMGGGSWGEQLYQEVKVAAARLPEFNFTFFGSALDPKKAMDGADNVSERSFDLELFEKMQKQAGHSISLAGYNTVYECMLHNTTMILLPFGANNEQGHRIKRLAQNKLCLELNPNQCLSDQIIHYLRSKPLSEAIVTKPNLAGAPTFCRIIKDLYSS